MDRFFDRPFTIDRTIRLLITGLLVWGAVLLLQRLSGVLLPFVAALALAYLLDPLVSFIQRGVRNSRAAALAITFLLLLVINAAFYAVVIPSVIHELERFQSIFEAHRESVFSWAIIPEHIRLQLQAFVQGEAFRSWISPEHIGPLARKLLPGVWSSMTSVMGMLASLVGLIAVLLYLVFILADYASFRDHWHEYLPARVRTQAVEFVRDLNSNMMRYFRQKTIIVLINIILFAIGFSILGLPLAILLAILVGLLNYIPYLQNLGLIPALLSAGLLSLETGQPLWVPFVIVIGIFAVVQILEDVVLVPWLMKEVTGMNPAIMLLSLAIWGSLLGMLGLIIALPVSSLAVTYYRRFILDPIEVGKTEPLNE